MNLRPMLRWFGRSLLALASALLLVGAGLYLHHLWAGPALESWHRERLGDEFTAARLEDGTVTTLAQYRALEDRLFVQLRGSVYAHAARPDEQHFARYVSGSLADPAAWDRDWNRTFDLPASGALQGGVLLLHGLTDSPYSLRSIGLAFAARGYRVIGLRLPGHGTAPSGLLRFEVEDLMAATRLAMQDLAHQVGGDRPLYVVGYSNGAALAVNYSLDALEVAALPRAAGLILISPAIGITRLAAIGRIRTGLSSLQGFGRAAWQVIEPEIDPFKYQSFSFHAAGATQRLTSRVSGRIDRLARDGPVRGLPPILAFLSTVDATVRASAVVDSLLGRLAPEGHELVLFDVNRLAVAQPLLVADPAPLTRAILARPKRPFALSLITNQHAGTLQVMERRVSAGSFTATESPLGLAWPRSVFSLSHVALPFPPDDPLYGYDAVATTRHVQLGRIEVRGENGVLSVPGWMLTRQRSNPFHAYLLERIARFTTRTAPAATAGS